MLLCRRHREQREANGWIESALLREPSRFIIFYGIVGAVILGMRIYQDIFYYPKVRIFYEEVPEPVMVGLTLSD